MLQFEPGSPLEIPVEGQDLLDPHSDISVSLQSVSGLIAGDDYEVIRSEQSRIRIRVNGAATKRLNSKDPMLVSVTVTRRTGAPGAAKAKLALADLTSSVFDIERMKRQIATGHLDTATASTLGEMAALAGSDRSYVAGLRALMADASKSAQTNSNTNAITLDLSGAFDRGYTTANALKLTPSAFVNEPQGTLLASEARTFVLFTPQDYRTLVLARQIEIQNITAFPLPEKEAVKLFGKFVGQNFYALRLTLTNPSDKDQIVSLGMIKAYGRALVATDASVGPPFTKPIDVAPQSQQQVYTMVQNGKSDLPREWIFRSLDLAGALATAIGPAFGASQDYIKAVAIATGTGLPGLKTLWVDKVPFHLQNIVNFAMPDLVKVPKGGSVDGKYLFFSKDRLQGVLQDPLLRYKEKHLKPGKAFDFSASVVSLSFDTLQIPFENITSSAEGALADKVADLKSRAGMTANLYTVIRSEWSATGGSIGGLTAPDFNKLQGALTSAITSADALKSYTNQTELKTNLRAWQTNTALLKPGNLAGQLFDSPTIGSLALSACISSLVQVEQGMLQSKPASLYEGTVKGVEKTVQAAEARLAFVQAVAETIAQKSLWSVLEEVKADAKPDSLNQVVDQLSKALAVLPKVPGEAK